MANPSKTELVNAIAAAVGSGTAPMTDYECRTAYNNVLVAIKTVDPVKGTPTVKY